MWITVHVQEDEGMSGLVQQLSSFSTGDISGPCLTEDVSSRLSPVLNPFGSHQNPAPVSPLQSRVPPQSQPTGENHMLPAVASPVSPCPTLHSSPLSHHLSTSNHHFSPANVTSLHAPHFCTEHNLSPVFLNSRQPVSLTDPSDVATPITQPHMDDRNHQS